MIKHNPQIELNFTTSKFGSFRVGSVQTYSSSRLMSEPTATAQVMLRGTVVQALLGSSVNGRSWTEVLTLNDLCVATMLSRDGKRHTDIVGLVKKVQVVEAEITGKPEHFVEVVLQDIAGELANYRIFWHPHLAGRSNIGGLGFLARSKGKIPRGKPNEVVKSLFQTFMNDDYIFKSVDGKTLAEIIEFRGENSILSDGNTALGALGLEGALWETLSRYSDRPWHELFVDVQHEKELLQSKKDQSSLGKVGLYHRPTPFDIKSWDKLALSDGWSFDLTEEERIGDGFELHKDLARVYSFFFCPGKGLYSAFDQLSMAFDNSGGILPLYDADLVRRFGFRELAQGTEYIQFIGAKDSSSGLTTGSNLRKWEALALRTLYLYQWFGYTDFYDGMFSVAGRVGPDPDYGVRIGSILKREKSNWQYYVTGVQQAYSFPNNHITRISVERGRNQESYKRWWRDRISSKYNSALSTRLPKNLLVKFGLWQEEDNLKIPALPAMAGDAVA